MNDIDVELKIRETVHLFNKSAGGWESCIHTTCDHGKKGPRAAFLFKSNSISFNCFNCGQAAVLDTSEAKSVPKKFRTILEDFGMDKRTIDEINFKLLSDNSKNNDKTPGGKPVKKTSILPKAIPLPSDFVMLDGNEDSSVGKLVLAELKKRKINPTDYPFMVCIKAKSAPRMVWENRLIVPHFKDNDLIFYQGQSLGGASPKYLNASHENIKRSRIISNYDVLMEKSEEPIYVVEGWYDSYHINGVAIFGNQIKDNQVAWLNKSYRDKVYIPDRYGDGAEIALDCLRRGWKVSVPYGKLDSNIKDISDMVSAYGVLYTKKLIQLSTSTSELDGRVKVAALTT